MVKEVTTAGAVAAVAPLLVGAFGVAPPPDGLWWAPYVITGCFGLVGAVIQLIGRRRRKGEDDEAEHQTENAPEGEQEEKK